MNINLPALAQKTNANLTHVERIVLNKDNRIMKIGFQAAYTQIYNVITAIFPLFGIDGTKEYYMETADYIGRNYKLISPEEIRTAFELYSTSQLDLDEDVKFYGKINIHTLGKIINSYILWRNKITYVIEKEKAEKLEQDILEKKREILSREYDKDFENKLKNFTSDDFNDVPIYWYDIAVRLGYLNWEEGEKEKLWEEAKQLALQEKPESDAMIDRKAHLKKIAEGNIPRARVIAFKLAVFKKIIKFTLDGK
ncbi:MAG: hypothetical protein EB117_16710 [Betaproteobacteria bacterium]|nr:hypothetical protein [Betaproteobacteria bacterium]